MQNDIDAINEYAKNTKRDMAELIDTDILSYARKNMQYANVIGTSYSTGTVSIATTGIVTGSGTTFTATMVGGYLSASSGASAYLVTAFTHASSITVVDIGASSGYTGGAVTDSDYVIKAAGPITITKSNIYENMVALRTALGQSLCPKGGRFVVMNAEAEGALLKAPEFIPAVQSAYNGVVEKGLLGSIAGFKIYSSELVDGNNTTGYWYFAGTKEFMAFATQISNVSVIPASTDPNSFISTCKGLLVYGRKVFAGTRAYGAVIRAIIS